MGYYLGRGCVEIGTKDATGALGAIAEFHCPEFEIETTTERAEHYNSCGAIKGKDLDVVTQVDPKVRMVIDTSDPDLLAIALGGTNTAVTTGGTFSNKLFPATVVVNKRYPVPGDYVNLDSLTITDSAGSPGTLAVNTNYTVDLINGIVTFVNLGSFVQPFKAAGEEKDGFDVVSIGTDAQVEKYIRFKGINIADDTNPPMIVNIFRASINPSKYVLKSSGNDISSFEFEPMCLQDPNAPLSAAFGQFGRIVIG